MELVSQVEIDGFLEGHPGWSQVEIDGLPEGHPGWSQVSNEITRTYELADFNEAMGFVNRVALMAEKADHHPDIDIRWNRVTLTLSTHSEGGLTALDLNLAARCDTLL